MAWTETYTVDDTANDKVVSSKLHSEIEAQNFQSANLTGVHLDGPGTVLTTQILVYFDVEPDSADKAVLATVIAAHDGVAVVKPTQITLSDGRVFSATSESAGAITWTEVT